MPIADFFPGLRTWLRNRQFRNIDHKTNIAISELPPHVLKDIGWPGAWERQRHTLRRGH